MPNNSTDTVKVKSLRFGFDAKNKQAEKFAAKYAAKRVTAINTETKIAIRNFIRDMIRDQIPPREAAKQIKNMVGLNRPQAAALKKYVRGLNPALSPAAKAKAGIKLKKKMIRRRGITIARTETIDALSAGAQQSWFQAQKKGVLGGDAKKEWMTTPFGACGICQRMNGQQVLLKEKFDTNVKSIGKIDGPTTHPNCRCGVAPVPGMGGMTLTPPPVAATGAPISTMARMAVNADGELLKGSDARKAILKYADDPESPYRVRIAKAQKDYDEVLSKYRKLELDIETQKNALVDDMGELRKKIEYFDPSLSGRRSVAIRELKQKEELYEQLRQRVAKELYDDNAELRIALSRVYGGLQDAKRSEYEEVLEKFIYNKTRNTNVDVDTSPSFSQKVQTKKLKEQRKALDEGIEAWRRMTDDSLYASLPEGDDLALTVQKGAAKVKVNRERDRAFARSLGDRDYDINLVLSDLSRGGRSTTVHELTHTIEYGNPDVLAEALRWRDLRTKGDTKRWLGHWTGDKGYKKREVAYDDAWKTRQNPDGVGDVYTGKVYELDQDRVVRDEIRGRGYANKIRTRRDGWQGATEVSTTGMEQMFKDPVTFARTQPELFDFIYERIIKRKYTHDTSKWSLRGSEKFKSISLQLTEQDKLRYYILDE